MKLDLWASRSKVPSSLRKRFVWVFSLLVAGVLLVSGGSSLYLSYQQSYADLLRVSQERVHSMAEKIQHDISDLEKMMALTATVNLNPKEVMKQRILEVEQLGRLPGIAEISLSDQNGLEYFRASHRPGTEVVSSLSHISPSAWLNTVKLGQSYRSPVYFVQKTKPYFTMAMAVGPEQAGITVAEIPLDFLLDDLQHSHQSDHGDTYVLDSQGRLLAHSNPAWSLGSTDFSKLPPVLAALQNSDSEVFPPLKTIAPDGKTVLSTVERIPDLGWLIVSEQPEAQLLSALYQAMMRAIWIFLGGVICAVGVSMLLVHKLLGPIRALRYGAQAIAAGSLSQRIDIRTGDEFEELAKQFNQMASQLETSYSELLSARQMAENTSKRKSDFLAMMSHEMRTPLSGVIGMLGIALRDAQLFGDSRKQIETARNHAQSLLVIVNDILDVAKIEANKLAIEQINFDLLDVIQESLAVVNVRAHDKDLFLHADLAPDLPRFLQGDPIRIRQVLLNLLGNAVKFTDRGEVQLRVSLTKMPSGDSAILFSVTDTGPGITLELQERLFQKFEQADLSTTRQYGGTGLGLAISKELVVLMGGSISVNSQFGKGSTFTFEIPMRLGDQPKLRDGENQERRHSHRLSVLCAEDGLTNQMIIRSLLEEMGHDVDIVEHGVDAIKALAQRDFDLVLMDGRMPYMDGETAVRCIRSGGTSDIRVRSRDINIIALTANASQEDREKYLAAGMNGFLSKPINEKDLFEEIGRVITVLLRSGHPLIEMPETASEPMVLGPPTRPGDLHSIPAPFDPLEAAPSDSLSSWSHPQRAPASRLPAYSGDPSNIMQRIAKAFIEDAPQRLEAARINIMAGNAQGAALEIHSLKGAAAYVSLTTLQKKLEILEKLADSGDLAVVAQGLPEVETLLLEGISSLKKY